MFEDDALYFEKGFCSLFSFSTCFFFEDSPNGLVDFDCNVVAGFFSAASFDGFETRPVTFEWNADSIFLFGEGDEESDEALRIRLRRLMGWCFFLGGVCSPDELEVELSFCLGTRARSLFSGVFSTLFLWCEGSFFLSGVGALDESDEEPKLIYLTAFVTFFLTLSLADPLFFEWEGSFFLSGIGDLDDEELKLIYFTIVFLIFFSAFLFLTLSSLDERRVGLSPRLISEDGLFCILTLGSLVSGFFTDFVICFAFSCSSSEEDLTSTLTFDLMSDWLTLPESDTPLALFRS